MSFSLMDASLASLAKFFLAAINTANEGFFTRVRIHVLCKVLLK